MKDEKSGVVVFIWIAVVVALVEVDVEVGAAAEEVFEGGVRDIAAVGRVQRADGFAQFASLVQAGYRLTEDINDLRVLVAPRDLLLEHGERRFRGRPSGPGLVSLLCHLTRTPRRSLRRLGHWTSARARHRAVETASPM